jgi:hypothetical protein
MRVDRFLARQWGCHNKAILDEDRGFILERVLGWLGWIPTTSHIDSHVNILCKFLDVFFCGFACDEN